MPHFLKTKTFRSLAIIAVVLVLYAVLGFVVAPKLVRSALLKDIPAAIDAVPTVGEIRINPFLLQVTVNDFALASPAGEKLLGFQKLFIDFELSSLWHRAYSFGTIELAAPYVAASLAKDGSLNLAKLQPKQTPADPNKDKDKNKPLPALRIGSFRVERGLVTYEDHTQSDVFAARLEPINFELREFTTGAEGGRFTFTAASKLGEHFEWHGHLSVQPIESDGEFRIDGLLAHTLWDYLEDHLNFVVDSGTINLNATYKFSLPANGAPNLQVDLANVGLVNLAVRPKDSESDWIKLPALSVTGTTLDLASRHAHVDLVSLTGLKVTAWMEADGSINLMKLAGAPAAAPSAGTPAPSGTAAPASAPVIATPASAPQAAQPPWQYEVHQFELREAGITAEDRSVRPTVKVALEPLSVQVNDISQDMSKPVKLTLDTRLNEKGALSVNGEVTPQPAAANLTLKLEGLALAEIQPYIAQRTSMTLQGGSLGVDGVLHYGPAGAKPALDFAGNINVEKLRTIDDALHDDFVNWDRLDIVGLHYTQAPDGLDIDRVEARKLYARVIIEADSSLNVTRVLKGPGAQTAAAAAPPPAAAADAPRAARKGGARARAAAATAPPANTMPMSIKAVELHGGQLNFTDLSVAPNFSAGIQKLEGSVVGLSSKPNTRAKIDVHGSVDTFSPVAITGEANVLSSKLYTDIGMSFHNIQLAVFNPYSGKFAGYNITKGKLTTDFHYKVDGRKLDATHHIVVDQLEFGDKTPSKDAVSLPIKLAVSLLKDRNGVIDLDIPVTGSLDDPQFKLGPIIWKVFVNILEKAVTAPFALLGSLFGGGADMQFVDFQPGVSTLDESVIPKVKSVSKALLERPQLKIEIPIAVVPEVDEPALVSSRYDALMNDPDTIRGKKKAGTLPAAFDQLDPPARLERLTQVYVKETGGEPKFPEEVTAIKAKPDLVTAKSEFLSKAIRDRVVVADADLQALGKQRALNVQKALLDGTEIDPTRVFVVANDKATGKDGAVRLELSLQ